jgi:hypothetical protein
MHSLSENMLLIEFSTEGSIETVSNTVDEVLSHISIGKMVLNDD